MTNNYLLTVMGQVGNLLPKAQRLEKDLLAQAHHHALHGRGVKYFAASPELVRIWTRLAWLEQEGRIAAHTPSAC